MSLETLQARYPVFADGFKKCTLREVVLIRKEIKPRPFVWSARLSTGIFGLPNCPSGNAAHAPKGENEVILALGDKGLGMLIEARFLPCPACHPENTPGFWEKAEEPIGFNWGFSDPHKLLDRDLIPFDSSRIDWGWIAPYLTSLPNRLYVPPGLKDEDLLSIKHKMGSLPFKLPPVGYYDRTSPTRFTEYNLKNIF